MHWDFIVRLLNITIIDITLSGDNAIVIGMAAASLPHGKRKWAIMVGGACAIVLRVVLTSACSLLMLIPFLSAIGGLVLVWVVYKLLKIDTGNDDQGKTKKAGNFRQAIFLILAADFMMSLDNIIAVAGCAHGHVGLLIIGLMLSMPLLMTTGAFISVLIDKMKWLVYVGAFAITFTAVRMVTEDSAIEKHIQLIKPLQIVLAVIIGLAIPAIFVFFNRRKSRKIEAEAE